MHRLALAGALLLCAALAGSGPASAASNPPTDRYTPLVMDVMSAPQWFRGADNQYHLVYELELTNGFPVPADVASLTVRNARTHRTVMTLTGDDLLAAMSPLVFTLGSSTTVAAAGISVVWMDLPFPRRSDIPPEIEHTVTATVPPGLPVPQTITSTGGEAKVDLRPPVALSAPVSGAG